MITNNLRVNQLSDDAYAWYAGYIKASDSGDSDCIAEKMADNISVQHNNGDPTRGKEAVLNSFAAFLQLIQSQEHELLNIYGSDQHFAVEALTHYVRNDGKSVTTRAVAVMDRDENGLLVAIRAYADASPLFEEHHEP